MVRQHLQLGMRQRLRMRHQVGLTRLDGFGRHLRRQPVDRTTDHHGLLSRHVSGRPRLAGQLGPVRHAPGLDEQTGGGSGRDPIVGDQVRPRRRRTTLPTQITVVDLPHQPRDQLVGAGADSERLTQPIPEPPVVQRPHRRIRELVETVVEPTQQLPHLVRRQATTSGRRKGRGADRHTPRIEATDDNSSVCSTPVDQPCGHPNLGTSGGATRVSSMTQSMRGRFRRSRPRRSRSPPRSVAQ